MIVWYLSLWHSEWLISLTSCDCRPTDLSQKLFTEAEKKGELSTSVDNVENTLHSLLTYGARRADRHLSGTHPLPLRPASPLHRFSSFTSCPSSDGDVTMSYLSTKVCVLLLCFVLPFQKYPEEDFVFHPNHRISGNTVGGGFSFVSYSPDGGRYRRTTRFRV